MPFVLKNNKNCDKNKFLPQTSDKLMKMTPLVDTHAHLADAHFFSDIGDVLQSAKNATVTRILIVTESHQELERARELTACYRDMTRLAIGRHPADLDPVTLDVWRNEIQRGDAIAVGEVGLDRWLVKDEADRLVQAQQFTAIVKTAMRLDLPLNVRSRASARQTLDILLDCGAKRVQMHALEAKASTVRRALEAGYYVSIPTSVVHSPQKRKLCRQVPLTQMLLETDSPVMAPNRGDRNEPANLTVAVAEIAQLRGISPEVVASHTTENALRLYDWAS